ncbi:DUF6428 family protein [Agrobacterium sp. P15N1-A]|uniref:DUF6428 family protein n=1 Tax=Agrobacterium sp. P15N1-A TaxID=3342820 RepID=UPI0037D20332
MIVVHKTADITLGDMLDQVAANPELPLVFSYNGTVIRPGYHVTEVKAAQFFALDCGANPEAWSEIFVQLWDIEEDDRTHMSAGKFATIVRKVSEHVRLDGSAKLTFEVSDGVVPMQLFCAGMPSIENGAFRVSLEPRAASCKPRDRWLAERSNPVTSCCTPSSSSNTCCA